MRTPRFTDAARFKLPYVRATHSRAPGWLHRRFDKYSPGWNKPPEQRAKP